MNNRFINWLLFIVLSIIWGSSFILMKKGMYDSAGEETLSAYHVAAIRILSAGLVLLPVAIRQITKIPKQKIPLILLSGMLGSFIPAFLFCIAETKIDISLAGFLNALTPVFTILIGLLFFNSSFQQNKIAGVAIAFTGMCILFFANSNLNFEYFAFAGFVLMATISYGFNVNIVGKYLKEIGSTNIAAIGFTALAIPSVIVLVFTGYFELPLAAPQFLYSTASAAILGVMGTAVASILFYILLKRAGTVFASMVTYGIPFIALGWGLLDGEQINLVQIAGLGVILAGVYWANKPR